MRKKIIKLFTIGCCTFLHLTNYAQTNVDFEYILIDSTGYNDKTGDVVINGMKFNNDTTFASWNTAGYYWSDGWAFSNRTDDSTGTFNDEFSTYAGYAKGDSGKFVVGKSDIYSSTHIKFSDSTKIAGFYATNTTYAALSMLNGDFFGKQFGDTTNGSDGKDWFKLTISGYNQGVLKSEVEFYLADYRFDNDALDYIVKDWKWINLQALGFVDSVRFIASSSDEGAFGMNTPAYFCMDNFTLLDSVVRNIIDTSFCENSSVSILGNTYSSAAIIFDTIGLDSVTVYNLSTNSLPDVYFKIDTVLCKSSSIDLVGKGVFYGNGVDSLNHFNAAADSVTIGLNQITLTYTDSNNCTNSYSDFVEVFICGGISKLNENLIQIYPTISSSLITINVHDIANYEMQLIDANGRILKQQSNPTKLMMNDMPTGIYIVKILTEQGIFMQKIVKQ